MFELWGHLFADGLGQEEVEEFDPNKLIRVYNTNSLVHYTGTELNSWEVVYDETREIHPSIWVDKYRGQSH